MSVKKRRKSFVSILLTLCLVLTFPASVAMAADSPLQSSSLQNQAANRMAKLKLIFGYGNGDFGLDNNLTRAELVTVLVRSFGQGSNADLIKGAPSFPDVAADAWYSGNIAIAKNMVEKNGDTLGLPNGTFAPNENVTAAEALVFTMKLLGVRPDPTKSWPDNYLDVAVQVGLITADDRNSLAPKVNQKVTRGLVFSLLDQAFSTYPVEGKKNVYQTYIDTEAPVLTLNVPTETSEPSLKITGTAIGASELRVNTAPITLRADGAFSYDVPMMSGKDNTIQVWAKDLAGNETTKTFVVKHRFGDPASIEVADLTVAAGTTIDLGAAVKDKYGNTIPEAAIVVESSLGTYTNGKFTAAKKAGTGTATLKAGSVAGKEIVKTIKVDVTASTLAKVEAEKTSAALGESVQLKAMDQYGNAITNVAWSQTSPDAKVDAKSGVFVGNKPGTYTVTVNKGDKSATGTITVNSLAARVVVDMPTSLQEGQSGTITVKVVDVFGNIIPSFNGTVHVLNAGNGVNVSVGAIKNGVATGTVSAVNTGTFSLNFQIMVKSESQSITVTPRPAPPPPVNHAPVWEPISPNPSNNDTFNVSEYVYDPDGDPLTITIIIPSDYGLHGFIISGSEIKGQEDNDPGTYDFTVTADDGKTSRSTTIHWVITSEESP